MLGQLTTMSNPGAMIPVLELHLSSLTIRIEDLESEHGVLHMVETLNIQQIVR
jgi:hypothetical protein